MRKTERPPACPDLCALHSHFLFLAPIGLHFGRSCFALAFLETPSCTPAKLLSLAPLAPNILSDRSRAFLVESSSDFFVYSYATTLGA